LPVTWSSLFWLAAAAELFGNGDFDDYWRYHLTQEHQRLYPGTTQG
jgi:hypothetical protein